MPNFIYAKHEIIRMLNHRGEKVLDNHYIMKDKHDIVYWKFQTMGKDYIAKFDTEYFMKFGEFYPEFKCKLGDSFCAGILENMNGEDVCIFVKPDGLFEVPFSTFMSKAKRRYERSGKQVTWCIPRDMFRRL